MKILSATQLKEADAFTILNEPVSSLDLMERASRAFSDWFCSRFIRDERPVYIFAGAGNNGGDGLAIARLLHAQDFLVQVFLCETAAALSPDCQENLHRLPGHGAIEVIRMKPNDPFPTLEAGYILDALWGTGLNRPVEGYWANLLTYLSSLPGIRVAVDIPSGMYADRPIEGVAFQAHYTCTFECPKLAFFFPESFPYCGEWTIADIGLHPQYLKEASVPHFFSQEVEIATMLRPRTKFAHKGTYGHALLIAGNRGMAGAAILAAQACLRSGVGLLSVLSAGDNRLALQTCVPEALFHADSNPTCWSTPPLIPGVQAIGLGPGIGRDMATIRALEGLLHTAGQPLIIDADALNIIAAAGWQSIIPKGSILTPHPKEFERLFGKTCNSFQRLELLRDQAVAMQSVILLKGAYTVIALPDGTCHFNGTGNPGMATGGSGDVLTGILTGLRAQGYSAADAAILGVLIHGKAGDLAALETGEEALIASDLTRFIGKAFQALYAIQKPNFQ